MKKKLKTDKKFIPCNKTKAWAKLKSHSRILKPFHLRNLFGDGDPKESVKRFKEMSLQTGSFFLDYSKNQLDKKTLDLLIKLSQEMQLESKREAMFSGHPINWTENRSVLHVLLRDDKSKKFLLENKDWVPEIREVLERMEVFAHKVREGVWKGKTGKTITDVVNIGIGGSYLGTKMAERALHHFGDGPRLHFISNVDGDDIDYVLRELKPETTLFLIASKTFTTEETLANARIAKEWITSTLGPVAVSSHFACMSTNKKAIKEFGIDPTYMFGFWDFVGGRYSIWSAIGLPLMISIGPERFKEFLRGGFEMDRHFLNAPLEKNLPVLLGMIGVWHNNFLNSPNHLVIPYSSDLVYFPGYLQQMDMESNGKRIDESGKQVTYLTGPMTWGEVGTDSQHSFFQLLHQGTHNFTIDFIASVDHAHPHHESHERLLANLFAQSESLAFGLTPKETQDAVYKERSSVYAGLSFKEFLSRDEVRKLIPHRVFPGNHSSNTLLIDNLNPNSLGKLIALYEHKVFVQGVIWGINSYDQWGVELGKRAAKSIKGLIQGHHTDKQKDRQGRSGKTPHPATAELVRNYLQRCQRRLR